MSDPKGGFLRANVSDAGRWYSRDVAAIVRTHGISKVAPFFVDADAAPDSGRFPVGGLTVVRFRSEHLFYALTWFALAALSVFGAALIVRYGQGRNDA